MLRLHLGDTPNDLKDSDFDRLGEITVGASGSDIGVLVKEALMEPLRRCQQAKQFEVDAKGFYHPCQKYPNCRNCPPKLSSDKPGKGPGRVVTDGEPRRVLQLRDSLSLQFWPADKASL